MTALVPFVFAAACIALLVGVLMLIPVGRQKKQPAVVLRPAVERRIVEVGSNKEVELELADGSRYRSHPNIELIWYEFPSGVPVADWPLKRHLGDESARLANLERWAHADKKKTDPW